MSNLCFGRQFQSLLKGERYNGRQLVRKGELYLSSKDYEISKSFVEIKFHRKDEMGTEHWRPYREGKLHKVLTSSN